MSNKQKFQKTMMIAKKNKFYDEDVVSHMKDENMIDRYSTYLNRSFFITNDTFLKQKHS